MLKPMYILITVMCINVYKYYYLNKKIHISSIYFVHTSEPYHTIIIKICI